MPGIKLNQRRELISGVYELLKLNQFQYNLEQTWKKYIRKLTSKKKLYLTDSIKFIQ